MKQMGQSPVCGLRFEEDVAGLAEDWEDGGEGA